MQFLSRWVTLRHIEIEEWDDTGEEHHVQASWKKSNSLLFSRYELNCPECGAGYSDLNRAGKLDRKVYDEPLRKPLFIELSRQRYQCNQCDNYILPSHPDIYRERNMTVRLVRYIWNSYLRGQPFWTISEKAGPATSTVQEVFHERAEIMDEPLTPKSATVLSMDEIHLQGHGYSAVFVDPDSREVIEMLKGMDLKTIMPFLRKHKKRLEAKNKQLEAVVMDMASHFRKAAEEVFPDAKVVVDRFHVERHAYGALHNVRRRVAAEADESGREPAPKDGFRTEWKRRKEKLEENWHTMNPREKMKLEAELKPMGVMENAYRTKQRFVDILEMTDRDKADKALRHWEESLTDRMEDDFSSVVNALSDWREELLNYFDTDYTNAFIESTNRTIRQSYEAGMKFKTLKARVKFGIKERKRYREEGRVIPEDEVMRVPL